MNIVQLEYFLSIAETGSFRKTAEKLYVSQPAVSKQISLLEKEWNVILFDRAYRTATLTNAGRLMYNKLSRFNEEFHNAIKDARLLDKHVETEIRIGLMECIDFPILFEIFENFQDENPDIMLTIEQVPLSKLIINNADSHYDMVFNHDIAFQNRNDVITRELFKSQRMVILSKDNPLLRNGTAKIEDMNHQRFYIPGSESEHLSIDGVIRICSKNGLNGIDYVMVPNLASVILAVGMNFGVGVVDSTVDLPKNDSIVTIPFGDPFGIEIAWHKENDKPEVELFAEYVLERVPKNPYNL